MKYLFSILFLSFSLNTHINKKYIDNELIRLVPASPFQAKGSIKNIYFNQYDDIIRKHIDLLNDIRGSVNDMFQKKAESLAKILIIDYVQALDEISLKYLDVMELLNAYGLIPDLSQNTKIAKYIEERTMSKLLIINNDVNELIDAFNFYINEELFLNNTLTKNKIMLEKIAKEHHSMHLPLQAN
tara:strand:+ start:470 stop:1024 length:555 start_codon:yes stop_codon:yes gene_type:complete